MFISTAMGMIHGTQRHILSLVSSRKQAFNPYQVWIHGMKQPTAHLISISTVILFNIVNIQEDKSLE